MFDAYHVDEFLMDLLHDTQAQSWDEAKRLRAINKEYDKIVNRIIQADEGYFDQMSTITPGTSQWGYTEYTLPTIPATCIINRVTDTNDIPIEPIKVQDRGSGPSFGYQVLRSLTMGWWMGHNKIYINAADFTESLRLYYTRRPPLLIKGTASAGAATTLTFATSPEPEIRDDYYNGVYLRLISGTAAPDRAEITDYVGTTRVATVDFTNTPDATSVYASELETPEGHSEIIAYGAAIRALHMDVAQQQKLDQFKQWYQKLEWDLIDFVERRQQVVSRHVHMSNLD